MSPQLQKCHPGRKDRMMEEGEVGGGEDEEDGEVEVEVVEDLEEEVIMQVEEVAEDTRAGEDTVIMEEGEIIRGSECTAV